jgi:hypothetical protein
MYKLRNILTVVLLLSVIAFSVFKSNSTYESKKYKFSLPSHQDIKAHKHMNKISSLKESGDKDKQNKAIKEYISKLDDKELLEIAAEIAEIDSENFEQSVMLVAPYLKGKWEEIPQEYIMKIAKDKKYSLKFRTFVIDGITTLKNSNSVDLNIINEDLQIIANDIKEDEGIRNYALLKLRKNNKKDMKSKLSSIVNDESQSAEVR